MWGSDESTCGFDRDADGNEIWDSQVKVHSTFPQNDKKRPTKLKIFLPRLLPKSPPRPPPPPPPPPLPPKKNRQLKNNSMPTSPNAQKLEAQAVTFKVP